MGRCRFKELWQIAAGEGPGGAPAALRVLLLAFAFWVPVSIVGAQIFGYSAALLALGILLGRVRGGVRPRWKWVLPITGYAVFSLVGALAGPDPQRALRRMHRLALLLLTGGPTAGTATAPDDPHWRSWGRRLLGAFVAGATAKALYDVLRIGGAWAHGVIGFALYDLGNMRDPQFYMCAVLMLVNAHPHARLTLGRPAWAGLIALNALATVLHFKRGVWLALGLTLVGGWGLRSWRRLAAILGVGLLLLGLPAVRHRLAALRNEWHPRASRRVLWTQVAPGLLRDHPWGVGRGVLRNEDLQKYGRLRERNLTHLHNNVLQVAVETGWAGLLLWLAWMLTTTDALIRLLRADVRGCPEIGGFWEARAVAAAFCALHLNGFVENNFGDTEIFMLFLLLSGLTVMYDERVPRRGRGVGPSGP